MMLNMFRANFFEVVALFSIRGALGQLASVFIAVYWDGVIGWARRLLDDSDVGYRFSDGYVWCGVFWLLTIVALGAYALLAFF